LKAIDNEQKFHKGRLRGMELHAKDMEVVGQVLGERAEANDFKIVALANVQRDTTIKLGMATNELNNSRALQVEMGSELRDATAGLEKLTGTVGATLTEIGQISSRVEVAHEYLDGLSHGVQDTHRHAMAGTSGHLPPKAPQTWQLPDIPTGVAPPSAQWTPERGAMTAQRILLNQLQSNVSQASTRRPQSSLGSAAGSPTPPASLRAADGSYIGFGAASPSPPPSELAERDFFFSAAASLAAKESLRPASSLGWG
jgi:hypothetical protein